MTDPISFETTTARFGLPLLYSGQAQKEIFVNESLSRLDSLLHCAIEGVLAAPPAAPVDGKAWLIAVAATGEWAGKSGMIATWQNGAWAYIAPRDGMRMLDRSNGQESRYFGAWQKALTPLEPTGGSTVDVQARSAISSLIGALRATGILPA